MPGIETWDGDDNLACRVPERVPQLPQVTIGQLGAGFPFQARLPDGFGAEIVPETIGG